MKFYYVFKNVTLHRFSSTSIRCGSTSNEEIIILVFLKQFVRNHGCSFLDTSSDFINQSCVKQRINNILKTSPITYSLKVVIVCITYILDIEVNMNFCMFNLSCFLPNNKLFAQCALIM